MKWRDGLAAVGVIPVHNRKRTEPGHSEGKEGQRRQVLTDDVQLSFSDAADDGSKGGLISSIEPAAPARLGAPPCGRSLFFFADGHNNFGTLAP